MNRASTPTTAKLPLLDRLIDDHPDQQADPPLSATQAIAALRASVQRDLEALLNARRRWRSWPADLSELTQSAVGYGLPDFTAGALNDPRERERLRAEIEAAIRRFEPRLQALQVLAVDENDALESRLRLRIEALLHAEPADEPVTFETTVDAATAEVAVRERGVRTDV
jgi:type VI secretion system protein ImpF